MTGEEGAGERLRRAREALPITDEEMAARRERYKTARYLNKPLTQTELAARIGVTDRTVKRWERDDAVSEDIADIVRKALGVDFPIKRRPRSLPPPAGDDLATLRAELEGLAEDVRGNRRSIHRLLAQAKRDRARILKLERQSRAGSPGRETASEPTAAEATG